MSRSSAFLWMRENRKQIIDSGVTYDMLTPDTNGSVEMMQLTLAPGMRSSNQARGHKGEEVALLLSGSIELEVENDTCVLHAGDSIRIKSGLKHRWRNVGEEGCVLVFAISPPDF